MGGSHSYALATRCRLDEDLCRCQCSSLGANLVRVPYLLRCTGLRFSPSDRKASMETRVRNGSARFQDWRGPTREGRVQGVGCNHHGMSLVFTMSRSSHCPLLSDSGTTPFTDSSYIEERRDFPQGSAGATVGCLPRTTFSSSVSANLASARARSQLLT